MREKGVSGLTRRKRRTLTKPDVSATTVPDLIPPNFTAPMPGVKQIADITRLPFTEGWLYLAPALDHCSKELVGYATAPHMRANLAVNAITAAPRAVRAARLRARA